MYLQKGTKSDIYLNLGYCFLEVKNNQIIPILKIYPYANYKAYNYKFTKALESGIITLDIFNIILNNQSVTNVFFDLDPIDINKSNIESIVEKYDISSINNTSSISIINSLNTQGYNIIKKI